MDACCGQKYHGDRCLLDQGFVKTPGTPVISLQDMYALSVSSQVSCVSSQKSQSDLNFLHGLVRRDRLLPVDLD